MNGSKASTRNSSNDAHTRPRKVVRIRGIATGLVGIGWGIAVASTAFFTSDWETILAVAIPSCVVVLFVAYVEFMS